MSVKKTARESARADLKIGEHRELSRCHLDAYRRWCAANSQPEMPEEGSTPDASQVLLRYLHSNAEERGWCAAYCSGVSFTIAQHFTRNGRNDPRDTRVRAWLKARLRTTGKRVTQPVDQLTVDEVRSAAEAAAGETEAAHLTRRRALVALADLFEEEEALAVNPMIGGPASLTLHHLPADAFENRGNTLIVTIEGKRVVVSQARTPVHYAAVLAALNAAAGRSFPLLAADVENLRSSAAASSRGQDQRSIRRALRRLTSQTASNALDRNKDGASTALAKEWWAASTRDERLRLMARIDGSLNRRVQELAYFLTGIVNLHRHAELARLTVGHMLPRPGGYDYTLKQHKGGEHAERWGARVKPIHGALDHAAKDVTECPPVCPACAMDRHLALRREDGALDTDPLFVSYRGSAIGQVLARFAGERMMKRFANQVDATQNEDGSRRRISSRSMRVTGATLLREAGASYLELMDAGSWSSPLYAALYVRRESAWKGSLVLPLDVQATGGEELPG